MFSAVYNVLGNETRNMKASPPQNSERTEEQPFRFQKAGIIKNY